MLFQIPLIKALIVLIRGSKLFDLKHFRCNKS